VLGHLLEGAPAGAKEEQMTMPQTATRAARGAWPVERFQTPKQCAGYWVRDPLGLTIGRLKRLFSNESDGVPPTVLLAGRWALLLSSLTCLLLALRQADANGN
jgi:hypothetical protein